MISSKSTTCKCGKTQDSNGYCDGSHANKRTNVLKSLMSFTILMSMFFLQSFTFKSDDVKIKNSKLNWVANKVSGSHEGFVNLKDGSLSFKDSELVGGSFVIDMTSIACTDLSGKYKGKLEEHLKSDDFFSVDKHPTAQLVITETNKIERGKYQVFAKLSIKEQTQPIEFTTTINEKTAYAQLIVDRTLYGIIYGSGNFFEDLADNMIYDEFIINVELYFEK